MLELQEHICVSTLNLNGADHGLVALAGHRRNPYLFSDNRLEKKMSPGIRIGGVQHLFLSI